MAYVYQLLHKPSGKLYIGSRSALKYEDDFWIRYFTSSNVIKHLISQNGFGNEYWQHEKIFESDTFEQSVEFENNYLRNIIDRSNYLNINFSAGGALIKSKTHRYISNGDERILWPIDIELPNDFYIIKQIPPLQKGTRAWIHTTTDVMTTSKLDLSSEGYELLKDRTKRKNQEKLETSGIIKRSTTSLRWFNNGIIEKKILIEEGESLQWKRGRLKFKHYKQRASLGSTKDKIAYTNGVNVKFLSKDSDVPDGYYIGSIDNSKKNIGKKKVINIITKETKFVDGDNIPDGWIKVRK